MMPADLILFRCLHRCVMSTPLLSILASIAIVCRQEGNADTSGHANSVVNIVQQALASGVSQDKVAIENLPDPIQHQAPASPVPDLPAPAVCTLPPPHTLSVCQDLSTTPPPPAALQSLPGRDSDESRLSRCARSLVVCCERCHSVFARMPASVDDHIYHSHLHASRCPAAPSLYS